MYNGSTPLGDEKVSKIDDLPFYYIGFKSSSPELTLRNRIWSLLCAQTLYRTISGVINYRKAIKLLYRVETQRLSKLLEGTTKSLNMSWNRWCGRSLSSSFPCSNIRSSARRSTRTPNSFSVCTPAPDCILLNLGSSTRLYGMRLTAALYNGAVRGQPVDSLACALWPHCIMAPLEGSQ